MDIEWLVADPRVTVRRGGEPAPDGAVVVYWMQRAVDNPALETSIVAATALGKPVLAPGATPKRDLNVLHHILGYLSDRLDHAGRQEMVEVYVRRFAIAYLQAQTYLDPHPKELTLRNHV